jgi:hypothetical protein
VTVEIQVCVAVLVYFRRPGSGGHWWSPTVSPVLAGLGLLCGLYLRLSRFGLLAGTVPDRVDPATTSWQLSAVGWTMLVLPFVLQLVGLVLGGVLLRTGRHRPALADIVS